MPTTQVLQFTTLQFSAVGAAPANTVLPAVTGNLWVGQTLTTTHGTWTGDVSGGFTYQWKDGSGNILGATSSTYVIGSGENTASIFCHVIATGTGGATAADSATVGPIGRALAPTLGTGKMEICANTTTPVFTQPAPTNLVAPVVSGLAKVGSLLSCTTGTWTGAPTFTYQWTTNANSIAGATSATYATAGDDIGASVSCIVTATTLGGATSQAASSSIIVIGADTPPGPFISNPSLGGFTTGSTRLLSLSSSNPHLAVFT